MAIRDKMRANAAAVLQEGETIQSVFAGQTVSQYWALLSLWIIIVKSVSPATRHGSTHLAG